MARLPETSESWINAIFFIVNLVKLLQVAEKWKGSFALFIKNGKNEHERMDKVGIIRAKFPPPCKFPIFI